MKLTNFSSYYIKHPRYISLKASLGVEYKIHGAEKLSKI